MCYVVSGARLDASIFLPCISSSVKKEAIEDPVGAHRALRPAGRGGSDRLLAQHPPGYGIVLPAPLKSPPTLVFVPLSSFESLLFFLFSVICVLSYLFSLWVSRSEQRSQ